MGLAERGSEVADESKSLIEIYIPTPKKKFIASAVAGPKPVEPPHLPVLKGPRDPVEVAANMQRYGLAWVCANCTNWYRGRERGIEVAGKPVCAAPNPCGGVAQRMGYPEYDGPLDPLSLMENCVMCGESAPKHVKTSDGQRTGYCEKHLKELTKLRDHDQKRLRG